MTPEQVNNLIRSYLEQSQYDVSPVQYHTHNQIDSPSFPFRNLSDAAAFGNYTRVMLTATQVKALHTTPITLVTAQGPNSLIIVDDIVAYLNYGGTAYTGANNLEFRYTDGSGTKVTADMSSTFLDSSASAYDYAPAITTEFTPLANKPIVVAVPTANPAAGTSPITFLTHYRVISFAV